MKKFIKFVFGVIILVGAAGMVSFWSTKQEAAAQLEIAEQRISAVKETGKKQLSLDGLHLLTELPASISELQNLERLEITHTRIMNLEPLIKLENLETLNISDTWVRDLEPLTKIATLHSVNMTSLQIQSLEPMTRIARLRWVNLWGTYALDGSRQHYETLSKIGRVFGEDGPVKDYHVITTKVGSGKSFQQNYIPDQIYLARMKFVRFMEIIGLSSLLGAK